MNKRDADSISTTLLLGVRAHDQDSWRRLHKVFRPIVEDWFHKKWRIDADQAAELTQNVFSRVTVAVMRFDRAKNGTFRGWLWTIAHNEAMDYFRRRERQPRTEGGTENLQLLANVPDEVPNQSREDDDATLRALLDVLEGAFSARDVKIIEMTVLQNRSNVDVADELGMTGNALGQAKLRAFNRLRSDWHELFGEWPFGEEAH